MTPTQQEIQQAVEVAKDAMRVLLGQAEMYQDDGEPASKHMVRLHAALSTLDGLHLYVSRFKPGDDAWQIVKYYKGGWGVGSDRPIKWGTDLIYREAELFTSRELAEAECERRNKEKP